MTWQAENTHPEIMDAFREKMREVIDPEIGLNIIELGLVRDLTVYDDRAEVADDSDHTLLPLWSGYAGNDTRQSRRGSGHAHHH